jgi:ubiquinone/menaquinone biosynthesis C-methylase UbiE
MERAGDDTAAHTAIQWEQAYREFQTPEQETRKFLRRLGALKAGTWDRTSRVLEVCCGRGSALLAWHRLGFPHILGLDVSLDLLAVYRGPGPVVVADARRIPLSDASMDIVGVQGGLHHLATPNDVELALQEMCRIVRPTGRVIIIEPWMTPFLSVVHAVVKRRFARRLSRRVDALGRMIDLERQTYEAWLNQPDRALGLIRRYVEPMTLRIRWGKLMIVGRPRSAGSRKIHG